MISAKVFQLPDFTSRQLKAVLAVAEYRSYVAAATYLSISQPALTRTIQQVESSLGVELFSRTTRQIKVTDAGKEFVGMAERVLNDLTISVEGLRKREEFQHGQLVVSSVLSLAGVVFPDLLADFSHRFPGIEINLREGIQKQVVEDVRSGVADLGIGYIEDLQVEFSIEKIKTEKYVVILPRTHPLSKKKAIALEDLADNIVISFPPDSRTRRKVDAAAAKRGIRLTYRITSNRLATIICLVKNGVGMSVLPESEARSHNEPNITSRLLKGPQLSSQLGFIRLRSREPASSTLEFARTVKNWLKDNRERR